MKYLNDKEYIEKFGEEQFQQSQKAVADYYKKLDENEATNKDLMKKHFDNGLELNYHLYASYLSGRKRQPTIFISLQPLIDEVITCLIISANTAAITLTNHILEGLLKLALVKDEVGLDPIDVNDWNQKFQEAYDQYKKDNVLDNNIKRCLQKGLITSQEEFELHDFRKSMRNGFSHSDTHKILKDSPDTVTMYHGKFSEPGVVTPVQLNIKTIPTLQALHTQKFVQENCEYYFEYVYDLVINIEKRLRKKYHLSKGYTL